jgi:NADH-quinone oxidoreductase subunit J
MTPELANQIFFFTLAFIAIASAAGMLLSRNAVHSALFLVLNFAVVSLFFLILGAPFIAMVQITVYAGAIMVLFLFVIMLLGAELLRQESQLRWQAPLATILVILFIVALIVFFVSPSSLGNVGAISASASPVDPDFGGPQKIGLELFSKYLLPFELTSFLLLVGMIGAVVLTRDEKKAPTAPTPTPEA